MKALTLISAFIGGAIAGCGAALLFAPEKGVDVRQKISACLQRKGIKISDAEVDALVAELAGSQD
ncbi:MAG: YtxH domain-containing protein [Bacteroides sp.]|nr:YtxH domain-containing protein [Bacteroidales bacterium]MBD5290764.1 YtxH domain-containing protein [Bacteroides sp.]MDE6231226.1 YtxH domain-containing protein [Muribaculaceae bacterium]